MSKYRVLGIALMVVLVASLGFLGCGKKSPSQANLNQSPQQENTNAGMLTGFYTQMNQNKGQAQGYIGRYAGMAVRKAGLDGGPPPPWQGPDDRGWYWFKGIDEKDPTDSLTFWLYMVPDGFAYPDSFVRELDFKVTSQKHPLRSAQVHLSMVQADPNHISGWWQFTEDQTWVKWAWTNSSVNPDDHSGIYDLTTSGNLRLAAHFEIVVDGSGTGFATWQGYRFVQYTFYPWPGQNGYQGYYTLASENWRVKHNF